MCFKDRDRQNWRQTEAKTDRDRDREIGNCHLYMCDMDH